ncbi:MAG: sigma-54-dependent Fis family transcriptional regulator [Bacteroidales bacterium]|nr:sigma-54-dependent Fis family transcriptional regulator [Bacteroidales bacterium]
MKEGKLLIADDNKSILNALQILLQREFALVRTISSDKQLMQELAVTDYDVVLLDMNFKAGINSGNEGIFWLREIKTKFSQVEVVMITAYGDVELAVKALKEGATDFVLKPWDNEKLVATLRAAYRFRKSNKEIMQLKTRESLLKNETNRNKPVMVGKSPAMQEVLQMVKKIARTDANVLITGENGTGKELIAREIHQLSGRNEELFVLVDLSSLTETLFESELFGHKKGSFTNAFEDRVGRFVLADKGTLFLDEIGNIPLNLQSKLLTVLQSRNVTPVGSITETSVDIRLISATNKNLAQMIAGNQFRQDLLYRMNTIQIHLPPLRERAEDIEELVIYYMGIYSKKYNKEGLSIGDEALHKLKSNPWPGNIRELQHAVEKAVILTDSNELNVRDFFLGANDQGFIAQSETLEDMEKRMIISTLKKNALNQSITAEQLGITRQTLYNKIKKYGI